MPYSMLFCFKLFLVPDVTKGQADASNFNVCTVYKENEHSNAAVQECVLYFNLFSSCTGVQDSHKP